MISLKRLVTLILLLVCLVAIPFVSAQVVPTPLQCGQILAAEATQRFGEQKYTISLAPGDAFSVSSETVGDYMRISVFVEAPTTGVVAASYNSNHRYAASWPPQYNTDAASFETSILSERGNYTITVRANSPGLYTLFVGCVLSDGTVISPGDVATVQGPTAEAPTSTPVSAAPAFGFAGLAPVDFGSLVPFSIPAGVPMTGGVTPSGGEILGYLVNGNEGEVLELHFTRLSGNLNLGLIVLSQSNELVFQASLITTNNFTTQLTLPSTGDYTVGVFRVDLLPPEAPQPTTFQIQAVVNP